MNRESICLVIFTMCVAMNVVLAQTPSPNPRDAAAGKSLDVASAAKALAPSGKLRVAVYKGSPTSILPGATPAETKGVGYELGRGLADRLGVPFEPVVFSKNPDVLAAVKAGTVDVAFTNSTPERARDMDFSEPFLYVEQSCLVPAGSAIKTLDDVDAPGVRVGVSAGSTSEKAVGNRLKQAQVVAVATLQQAAAMLKAGELQAFSTNKAILYELSDQVPGSQVLAGAWGRENFAAGIPKGRLSGMPLLNQYLREAQQSGAISRAVERAGLRGTVPATR